MARKQEEASHPAVPSGRRSTEIRACRNKSVPTSRWPTPARRWALPRRHQPRTVLRRALECNLRDLPSAPGPIPATCLIGLENPHDESCASTDQPHECNLCDLPKSPERPVERACLIGLEKRFGLDQTHALSKAQDSSKTSPITHGTQVVVSPLLGRRMGSRKTGGRCEGNIGGPSIH